MGDSFLEELGLATKEKVTESSTQVNNRYITTRRTLSSPINVGAKNDSCLGLRQEKKEKIISSSNVPKIKISRRSGSHESSQLNDQEKKPLSSTPKSDRRSQDLNLLKPVENQIPADRLKSKPNDTKAKLKQESNKSAIKRRSGSSGGSQFLDGSTKENTRPLTDTSTSRESGSQDLKKDLNRRVSDGTSKKSDILEKTDPVMLLNAIKDLVSRYTEQETVKVLKAVEAYHVNSQATLIKELMIQTSEIVNELSRHKNADNIKLLVEENERMREDILILRAQNEVLQKTVGEMLSIKEENISLKLKLKELQQSTTA